MISETPKYLSALLLLMWTCTTLSMAQSEDLITARQLQKDFDEFVQFVDAHPDPWVHVGKEEFQLKLDATKQKLDSPLSELEFFKHVASLTALFKDGHSRVYMPDHWLKDRRKRRGAVPFEFHLSNENELFVIKKFKDLDIPVGSRITMINGVAVDSFLNVIDPYISYEQINFRNSLIERQFEFYLYLAFGEEFELTLSYFSDKSHSMQVPFMPFEDFKKVKKSNREERDRKLSSGRPYQYKKIGEGIGVLELYGFFARDVAGYELFLHQTFKQMKKDSIHSLIIDIRENLGGWPKIASYLFHYISETHFKTMARSSMKVSDAYRKFFLEQIPLKYSTRLYARKRRHFVDLQSILNAPLDSYVEEDEFFNEAPITKDNEFQGDCYVLTDRSSFSAASGFASTFQCYRMGYIIGEETGGTKIFRANPISHILSKSRLQVFMSTTTLYCACYDQESQGVKADFAFNPSVLDRCSDMDSQLMYALRVINKIRKSKSDIED